jgi:hypothetical protein
VVFDSKGRSILGPDRKKTVFFLKNDNSYEYDIYIIDNLRRWKSFHRKKEL